MVRKTAHNFVVRWGSMGFNEEEEKGESSVDCVPAWNLQHTHAYTHKYTPACTHVYSNTHGHIHTWAQCIHTHIHVDMHT